jgi:hypothetical protein
MDDVTLTHIQTRLQRLERQNRILIGLLCAAVGVGSIAATNAAPNVVTADEVRAHRFTLLDPNGGVADDWYSDGPNPPAATETSRRWLPGYSGWGYHAP